jgi:chromosome segregation ATPase
MFEENALFEVTVDEAKIEPVIARREAGDRGMANNEIHAGASSRVELGAQANLLFGLIRDFKLMADRACVAALREARHSSKLEEMAGAELTSLRIQLREKVEALEERDHALREREAFAQETINALETTLRDKEEQLQDCHARSRALLGEIDGLNLRLNEAANAMKQSEARFRDFADHQQGKISFLCQELKSKDNLLQAKDAALKQLDDASRSTIESLEARLQAIGAILETKDAELREKESALEATAGHERTVAQLMQQLALESQALMAELWEKNELVAELENKTHRSFDEGFMIDETSAVQERLL